MVIGKHNTGDEMSNLENIIERTGIREGVIERLLKLPAEIEEAEKRCIDGQVRLDRIKRNNIEEARRILQREEFEASAVAYGLDLSLIHI